MSEINKGLEKLGEHMAIKKYLYREEQEVFDKIEKVKNDNNCFVGSKKLSTKDAITFLINRGFEAYTIDKNTPGQDIPKET